MKCSLCHQHGHRSNNKKYHPKKLANKEEQPMIRPGKREMLRPLSSPPLKIIKGKTPKKAKVVPVLDPVDKLQDMLRGYLDDDS